MLYVTIKYTVKYNNTRPIKVNKRDFENDQRCDKLVPGIIIYF